MELKGVIPAAILPMTATYEIDEEGLRHYIRWLSGFKGIAGLAINADAGEGHHLCREERKRVLQIVAEEVKGRVPIIAGLFAEFTAEAVELARDARKTGADAVLAFPPRDFMRKPLDSRIPYDYHKSIGESANIRVVLFQTGALLQMALEYSAETLTRLTEIEEVVAIKEASFSATKFLECVRTLKAARRRISILTGNDDFVFESFLMGADGALISMATIGTDLWVKMFELVQEGRHKEAMEIWELQLRPVEEVIYAPPQSDYKVREKEALVALGIIKEAAVRPPMIPINGDEKERIRKILEQVGLLP